MLVFLNAFNNKVDAIATKPPDMSDQRFSDIEKACRAGQAYRVSTHLLAIMRSQPHPDCFLVLSC